MELFTSGGNEGQDFRDNIRAYNSLFAFTSMGVILDDSLANARQGVYTFRAQGSVYHSIGDLLPRDASTTPKFLQLYIYDTEHELQNRLNVMPALKEDTIAVLQTILDEVNPYVRSFRQLRQLPNIDNLRLVIRADCGLDQRVYNMPSASEVAAVWVEGDDGTANDRDIIVYPRSQGGLQRVSQLSGSYDSMQYPLLFPRGQQGWHPQVLAVQLSDNGRPGQGRRERGTVTCMQYYSYLLHHRSSHPSLLHLGGRLFQQYVVDNYIKMECLRLEWIKHHQQDLRTEVYRGLQDAVLQDETNANNIGQRVILPSSFIGGPRDMQQ